MYTIVGLLSIHSRVILDNKPQSMKYMLVKLLKLKKFQLHQISFLFIYLLIFPTRGIKKNMFGNVKACSFLTHQSSTFLFSGTRALLRSFHRSLQVVLSFLYLAVSTQFQISTGCRFPFHSF